MFKHDTGQLFLTLLVVSNIDIRVDGQFVGVQESPQMGPGLNKVRQSLFWILLRNELAMYIISPGTTDEGPRMLDSLLDLEKFHYLSIYP
jgi:hypothetical protein